MAENFITKSVPREKASQKPLNLARFRAFLFEKKFLHNFLKNLLTFYNNVCIFNPETKSKARLK